jgi:hypothetical protein
MNYHFHHPFQLNFHDHQLKKKEMIISSQLMEKITFVILFILWTLGTKKLCKKKKYRLSITYGEFPLVFNIEGKESIVSDSKNIKIAKHQVPILPSWKNNVSKNFFYHRSL